MKAFLRLFCCVTSYSLIAALTCSFSRVTMPQSNIPEFGNRHILKIAVCMFTNSKQLQFYH